MTAIPLALSLLLAAAAAGRAVGPSFTRAEDAALHAALQRWMVAHSPGFRHVPERERGNFVGESWCSPSVSEGACTGGAVVYETAPGTAWRQLDALRYPSREKELFGVVASIGEFPAASDLGVSLFLSQNGASIVGEGFSISFASRKGSGGVEELQAGGRYAVALLDRQEVSLPAPGGWREELRRLSASPESLRETLSARLDSLERLALSALSDGTIQGFDEGPYRGGGIPPLRTRRALRDDERAREAAALRVEIGRRRDFARAHGPRLHALLVGSLPVPELLAP